MPKHAMGDELVHPIPKNPTTALNGAHFDVNTTSEPHLHTPMALSGASTPSSTSPGPVSAEAYFASHVAPKSLPENAEKIRAFVDRHMHEGRRVVLVTVSK